MSLLNRPLLGIVAFFGISSIIGSGFCMWVFGAEGETSLSTEAKIEVSALADVGKLRLIGNLEAQQEVKEDYKENNKLEDAIEENWDNLQTNDGVKIDNLIKMYTTRKIVFTEGNEDSNNLKDGLTFYRFKRDKDLDIRTYIRENEVRGGYAFVPSDQYEAIIKSGMKFKIGLRVTMPPTDNGKAISDYLELDEKYNPDNSKNPTFSIYQNGSYVNFLDLTDGFLNFKMLLQSKKIHLLMIRLQVTQQQVLQHLMKLFLAIILKILAIAKFLILNLIYKICFHIRLEKNQIQVQNLKKLAMQLLLIETCGK